MPKASRIAYLAGEYPAVSHTFILREVLALRAQGIDVITCSMRRTNAEHHRGPDEQEAARSTFNVLAAAKSPATLLAAQIAGLATPGRYFGALRRAWGLRGPGLRAALYQIIYFLEATVLARHLKAQGVTHLHNHFAQASCTVALLTARLADLPFSFTLHGPADFTDPKLWRLDAKIAEARFVSCISHYCRSQGMLVSAPADWDKLHIIHCGVDPAQYQSGPTPEQTILFVGRLAAAKGLPVLLDSFEDLRRTHPKARLILIGDGPDRAALDAHTAARGLTNEVVFTGYKSQSEVAQALRACTVFALPSFAEGVPVVLMEAMAACRPVIATRIAGIPELVVDGTHGWIVAPGDKAALTHALRKVLDDPEAAQAMGQKGRAQVIAAFNIKTEAAKLAPLLTRQ